LLFPAVAWSSEFLICKIIKADISVLIGQSYYPDMIDKNIVFISQVDNEKIKIASEDIREIQFYH
jgi:hypothetical protein